MQMHQTMMGFRRDNDAIRGKRVERALIRRVIGMTRPYRGAFCSLNRGCRDATLARIAATVCPIRCEVGNVLAVLGYASAAHRGCTLPRIGRRFGVYFATSSRRTTGRLENHEQRQQRNPDGAEREPPPGAGAAPGSVLACPFR